MAIRSCNAFTGLSWRKNLIHIFFRPLLNVVADVKLAPSLLAAEFTFGKKQAANNVNLIHNAVDLSVYHYDSKARNQIRDELGLKEKLVVGHIGRFTEQKNHHLLLQIYKKIKDRHENAALVLVGNGELRETICKQAECLGISSSVFFLGIRRDVPQILSAMDVFVFPSFFEGMPNTVIEAQATGLPCILSDTITREADITGLVEFIALDEDIEFWVDKTLSFVNVMRRDTKEDFIDQGYDMNTVAMEFISLIINN